MCRAFLLTFCLLTTGIGAFAANAPADADARSAALQWLGLLDAGQYMAAYQARPPRVKVGERQKEEFLEACRLKRAPLGRAVTREFRRVKHTHTLVGSPGWELRGDVFQNV